MISFDVDSAETAKQILSNVKIIQYEESLGGVESLITYPILQTHADVPEEKRAALLEVLSQDPRPSYHKDPERVYGFPYAGFDVRFRVAEDALYVCDMVKVKHI